MPCSSGPLDEDGFLDSQRGEGGKPTRTTLRSTDVKSVANSDLTKIATELDELLWDLLLSGKCRKYHRVTAAGLR